MERRGGRGGPSRGGSRGRGSSFSDRGGSGTRGRGFSRGGRGVAVERSESRFSRDDRTERPPYEGRGGGRGGYLRPRGRGGFNRDFRGGGGRSVDRDFRGGRMDRGRGGRAGKRPASGPPQLGKRPRYEGSSSYPDANGYSAPYQSYERNPPAQSSYQTQQQPYRGNGSSSFGGESTAYGSSSSYGGGGYMAPSGYDSAGDYGGYTAPPSTDLYGDSYKSKHYEGSSSGYGQSREYSSQPRSRY